MNTAFDDSGEFSQTEALLLSAADYMEVSSDLRPRVLEAARAQAHEATATRRNGLLLAAMVVFALLTRSVDIDTTRGPRSRFGSRTEVGSLIFADSDDLWNVARSAAESDATWGLVEAFQQMRAQQSQAFHQSF